MAGEKTGSDMRDDSHAYEKPDVLNAVAQHLEEFGGEPSIPEPPAKSAGEPEPTSEPEPKVEPEPTDAGEPTPKEPDGQAAGEGEEPEKPALPDNYFRAAQHQGWTPEEITELYDQNPEQAIKTFGKIYEATNNLSQQFAQMGRTAIELEKRKAQAQQTPKPQVVEQKPSLDVEKLRKQYEDDPFGATVELMKAMTQKSEPAPQATQVPQTTGEGYGKQTFEEDMAILQQLNQFFGAEDMRAYEEFYGVSKDADGNALYDYGLLSPGQRANRQAVVNLADQILAGAELQGTQMSVAQGLELAHLAVTRPMSETVIREKLVSAVKKRGKGVTLKPSGARTSPEGTGGGKKTETQLEIDTEARLANLRAKGM